MFEFNVLPLNHINCSGTSTKGLYGALSTNMFFGSKSELEVRVDKGINLPYFTASIPQLKQLSASIRKETLLTECLALTTQSINTLAPTLTLSNIDELIVLTTVTSERLDTTSEQSWPDIVAETVKQYLPQLAERTRVEDVLVDSVPTAILRYAQNINGKPKLVITVDVLNSFQLVKQLNNKIDLLVLGGNAGAMPAEGAASCLLLPSQYGDQFTNQLSVKTCDAQMPIKAQLDRLELVLPSTVIHFGSSSERWVKHWYGQTNHLYHQSETEEELTLYDQTQILGYMGVTNLLTGFLSALATLDCPMNQLECVWLVEHQINSKHAQTTPANVYQVSRCVK